MLNGGNSMAGHSNGNSFEPYGGGQMDGPGFRPDLEPQLIYPDPFRRMP